MFQRVDNAANAPRPPLRLAPDMVSRKLQVLHFVEHYYALHKVGPSLGEIAAALQTNRTRVQDALRKLASERRIHRVPGARRGIRPINAFEDAVRQLEAAGYIVWSQTMHVFPPATVTNTGLIPAPDLDHDPDADG
jgi:SOS-response transcriptional repressor LexA